MIYKKYFQYLFSKFRKNLLTQNFTYFWKKIKISIILKIYLNEDIRHKKGVS